MLVELGQETVAGGFGVFRTIDGERQGRSGDVAAQISHDVVHCEAELLRNVRVHTTPTAEHCGACSWSHGFILIGQDRSAKPYRTVGVQKHRVCACCRADRYTLHNRYGSATAGAGPKVKKIGCLGRLAAIRGDEPAVAVAGTPPRPALSRAWCER
ncbi:hypothetical protein GCM10017772_31470 [Promicromonospora soli]|uniref:Uncharacterized protein n=1 Tax=Promicromonospora soli TaxID=2035533 RepID=A0A919G0H5_9MICO|nr:hypothetical protein GCM10017772_31470 [Promicromonospora soli]